MRLDCPGRSTASSTRSSSNKGRAVQGVFVEQDVAARIGRNVGPGLLETGRAVCRAALES